MAQEPIEVNLPGAATAAGCPSLLKVTVRQSEDGRKKKIKISNAFIKITIRVKDPGCAVVCEQEEASAPERRVGFARQEADRGASRSRGGRGAGGGAGGGFRRSFTLGFLPPPPDAGP